jgi:hypothetical protein
MLTMMCSRFRHGRPRALRPAGVPAIHVFFARPYFQDVDARHKAGHDG